MATKATPKAAERVLRERKGIALRLAGATYAEIGEQLEMSESGAYRLVRRCLDRERARTEEDAETLRQIDLMRVERAILALWAQVKAGHLGAIDRLLRCLDIRAKYLGLYAPVRRELSGPEGGPIQHEYDFSHLSDEELDAAIAAAEAAERGEAAEAAEEAGAEE
jgi:transposase